MRVLRVLFNCTVILLIPIWLWIFIYWLIGKDLVAARKHGQPHPFWKLVKGEKWIGFTDL